MASVIESTALIANLHLGETFSSKLLRNGSSSNSIRNHEAHVIPNKRMPNPRLFVAQRFHRIQL